MAFTWRGLIEERRRERPDHVVITEAGTDTTWRELHERSIRIVSALVRDGSRPAAGWPTSGAEATGGTYFICRDRQSRHYDLDYLKLDDVEAAVDLHLATARLSKRFRAEVRRRLDDIILTELDGITSLTKRLTAIDAKENSYVDLIDDPDWPQAKIKAKLAAVAGSVRKIVCGAVIRQAEAGATAGTDHR